MPITQNFGGDWTERKLDCLKKYLTAYMVALKDKHFHKIYIDAFSGTGGRYEEIEEYSELEETQISFFEGSASIALGLDQKFDEYHFIEKDPKKCKNLTELVEGSGLSNIAHVHPEDVNIKVPEICATRFHKKIVGTWGSRGIIFLDPFSCQVSWDTVRSIAATKAIDMWYLFPTNAVLRTMTKELSKLEKQSGWEEKLDYVFGSNEWKSSLYRENPQGHLFGERDHLRLGIDDVEKFIVKKLKEIFPHVANKTLRLCNSKNSPLFSLFFAVANPSPAAGKAALNIANSLLKE